MLSLYIEIVYYNVNAISRTYCDRYFCHFTTFSHYSLSLSLPSIPHFQFSHISPPSSLHSPQLALHPSKCSTQVHLHLDSQIKTCPLSLRQIHDSHLPTTATPHHQLQTSTPRMAQSGPARQVSDENQALTLRHHKELSEMRQKQQDEWLALLDAHRRELDQLWSKGWQDSVVDGPQLLASRAAQTSRQKDIVDLTLGDDDETPTLTRSSTYLTPSEWERIQSLRSSIGGEKLLVSLGVNTCRCV